jgi:hypothetical protein
MQNGWKSLSKNRYVLLVPMPSLSPLLIIVFPLEAPRPWRFQISNSLLIQIANLLLRELLLLLICLLMLIRPLLYQRQVFWALFLICSGSFLVMGPL